MKLSRFPYWQLLAIPALAWCLGLGLNQAVLIANHGKFPVMVNEVQYEIHCTADEDSDDAPSSSCVKGGQFFDREHSVMGPNSRLKPLADILPIVGGVYSIGDTLLLVGGESFAILKFMWLALVIRKASQNLG